MPRAKIVPPAAPPAPETDNLHAALLESRERWRDFALLGSDLAFEADPAGHITFIHPPNALGHPAGSLIGQPGALLLADPHTTPLFNPFEPPHAETRRRAWLKDATGALRCYAFALRKLVDSSGHPAGTRGTAQDITAETAHDNAVTSALRRSELLEHILWRMRQETLAPRMIQTMLESLMTALGAAGAVLFKPGPSDDPLHAAGTTPPQVLARIAESAASYYAAPFLLAGGTEQTILLCPIATRFNDHVTLTLWRDQTNPPPGRPWEEEDCLLAASIAGVMRVVLEQETIQREAARQARTDPLTGLLNRRTFIEEMERRITRAEREGLPHVLIHVDIDHFGWINEAWGPETADDCLTRLGATLRATFRPADLVARLGSDEFAIWMDGADQFAAAERAEHLRAQTQAFLAGYAQPDAPKLGVSIGMACRAPCSGEGTDSLMRRADLALNQIKRRAQGGWLVSQEEPIG